ncbi:dTDP-4-dehydrorhamnose reductase family protein [Citrobacter braakii]|uniref:dTDP-4-dehydrorhamnose reductase family protein n=1 Tax=Citrobacter braakii TaxID=57706 RepID=UPI00201B8748|nr:SDR family oxidoreductase [Citrobacter braakii]MEB2437949.1 SDR family oxidoreductase [Citrobacter braakii]
MLKVMVLGVTGMLGYSLFANLKDYKNLNVIGTARNLLGKEQYFNTLKENVALNVDATDIYSIDKVINSVNPDVVINCIGLIKQHEVSKQHVDAIKINALLPHQLADLCNKYNAKLIQFSTDCVFDGTMGLYRESHTPNSTDLYGKSKCLGEVNYGKHLTLRTSIIGHELNSSVSLIDWFLSQSTEVNGYSKAIFSGLPTCYIAKLLAEKIIVNDSLKGIYHLSAEPIDKYTLISLVSEIYGKSIKINKSEELIIDRTLDSARLREAIGFIPPSWYDLIKFMFNDYVTRYSPCKN